MSRALTPNSGWLTSLSHRPPPGARRRAVVAVCASCVPAAKCRYGGVHLRASDRDVLGHALRRDPLAATHHWRSHLRRVCTSAHAAPTPPERSVWRGAVMRHETPCHRSSRLPMPPDGSVFLGLVLATLVGTVRRGNRAASCDDTPGVYTSLHELSLCVLAGAHAGGVHAWGLNATALFALPCATLRLVAGQSSRLLRHVSARAVHPRAVA